MWWLIIAIILIVIFIAVLYYVFSIAFMRQDISGMEDIDDPVNAFLSDYRNDVIDGMKFIDNQPYEEIYAISYDNLKLYGRYYKNGESKGTILLFHGYRSAAKRDFSCVVKLYYNMGLNVLLVDQRAHGKSEGKLITYGIKESRDVVSWIEFLCKKYGEKEYVLDGLSMGATTVLLSTRFNLPDSVKGIIADCGFTSPAEIIGLVSKRNFHISSKISVPLMNFLCKVFGGFDLKEFSTDKILKNNTKPLLLTHGKSDGFVPCEMSQRAYNAASGDKELYIVDDADHGMSFLKDKENVVEKLSNFLSKNFTFL